MWTSVYNQRQQKKENAKNREHAAAMQEDAQAFDAEQAQLNRNFQSKEAELAYDRQVDFFENYQSIGAQVNQMREAGLNPALMAGNASAGNSGPQSAPSGSAGHSSAVTGPASAIPPMLDMAKSAMDIKSMQAAIEEMQASAREKRANALVQEINGLHANELNEAKVKELLSRSGMNLANTELLFKKMFTEEMSVQQMASNIRVANEEILNMREGRRLTTKQIEKAGMEIEQIGAAIANTNQDTIVKSWQVGLVIAETALKEQQMITSGEEAAYLRSYAGYLTKGAGLTDAQTQTEIVRAALQLQQYDHNEVMNAFNEVIAKSKASEQNFFDPSEYNNPVTKAVCMLMRMVYNGFGANVNVGSHTTNNTNTNTSTSTNTTTMIDGNPTPVRRPIGYK